MIIAVIGPGSEATEDDLTTARSIGALIAAEGWTLLTGGLDGVMAAASTGAAMSGGPAVGLLPGNDPGDANPAVSLALATGLGELRNGLLVRAAAGVICVGGSWGTLSEVALAVRTGKPVVQLGGWQVVNGHGVPQPGPVSVSSPEEAVAALKRAMAPDAGGTG